MRRIGWLAAVLVVALSFVVGVRAVVERAAAGSARAEGEGLRDEVRAARSELHNCLDDRDRLEAEFRRQEARTLELRARIDSLESLDPRGVPGDRYEDYLRLLDVYHESLPRWEGLARELEDLSAVCTTLARDHNAKVDSLQRFLVEEGLWEEEWLPDASGVTQPGGER